MQHQFRCRCGSVRLEAIGAPIVGVTCNCSYCVAANHAFTAMGDTESPDEQKCARAVLFRNDRVRLMRGKEQLDQFRFGSKSPTRRLWARCCSTPMLLDFEGGYWLTLYRERGSITEEDLPGTRPNLLFVLRLMLIYAGMAFRRPASDPEMDGLPEHLWDLKSPNR